jgi:hypothetical protein
MGGPWCGAGGWRADDSNYSSASDISDAESDSGQGAGNRGWRVRLASLTCLQVQPLTLCQAIWFKKHVPHKSHVAGLLGGLQGLRYVEQTA